MKMRPRPQSPPIQRTRAAVRPAASVAVLAIGAALLVGAGAAKAFRPPRTAVADISAIFEGYAKKDERQSQLSQERERIKGKVEKLEEQYKDLLDDLQMAQAAEGPASESLVQKKLKRYQLELQVELLKDSELKRLQEQYVRYLQEIRQEITDEIRTYASAQNLDLVLEKTVIAEATQGSPGFRWPIVHYVKPELDITNEIIERLNHRYRNP